MQTFLAIRKSFRLHGLCLYCHYYCFSSSESAVVHTHWCRCHTCSEKANQSKSLTGWIESIFSSCHSFVIQESVLVSYVDEESIWTNWENLRLWEFQCISLQLLSAYFLHSISDNLSLGLSMILFPLSDLQHFFSLEYLQDPG